MPLNSMETGEKPYLCNSFNTDKVLCGLRPRSLHARLKAFLFPIES